MNSRALGRQREKIIIDQFIKSGWKTLFKSRVTRFGSQDFADLFDAVFVKGKFWVLVQVKSLKCNGSLAVRKEIAEWMRQHAPHQSIAMLYVFHEQKWFVWEFSGNGEIINLGEQSLDSIRNIEDSQKNIIGSD